MFVVIADLVVPDGFTVFRLHFMARFFTLFLLQVPFVGFVDKTRNTRFFSVIIIYISLYFNDF
ncbi:MAG: hypothetical protein COA85_07450 [Robiginitomaculum sp.]|nr:MAG: hypothetical protein COA85_07450 [Robiginitomaculum sp.]